MLHRILYTLLMICIPYQFGLAEIAPEPINSYNKKHPVTGNHYMAVTAHKLASEAAAAILKEGGNAIDAAITAQLVLNVVEPQSSGIGGGGFLLYYDARNDTLTSFDGRETAPSHATPTMFLDKEGTPIPFMKAVRSGVSVGTPGLLSLLHKTHKNYGKLEWKYLFQPSIKLAKNGFLISPRLHKSINYAIETPVSTSFKTLFLDNKHTAKPIGATLKNLPLANTLTNIAKKGPDYFYNGPIAKHIAATIKTHNGHLNIHDMKHYQAKERPPVCGTYRGYRICGMGLPSSGGITLLQTLAMLSSFTLDIPYSAHDIHLILEAEKRAFADRNHYLADSDHTIIPKRHQMLSPHYLHSRAQTINHNKASTTPQPPGNFNSNNGQDNSYDAPSTTHISIVDQDKNAVSLTSSVEHSFGSSIIVDGFILNNQMTDFSFHPTHNNKPVANAVAPGKRPRSSMSPTIIFAPDGTLHAVLGSPGGSSIIPYVRKTIIALLDWKMNLQEALNAPHFMHKNTHVTLEKGQEKFAKKLKKLGHNVSLKHHNSGVHAILINKDGTLTGAADPRREGLAIGH